MERAHFRLKTGFLKNPRFTLLFCVPIVYFGIFFLRTKEKTPGFFFSPTLFLLNFPSGGQFSLPKFLFSLFVVFLPIQKNYYFFLILNVYTMGIIFKTKQFEKNFYKTNYFFFLIQWTLGFGLSFTPPAQGPGFFIFNNNICFPPSFYGILFACFFSNYKKKTFSLKGRLSEIFGKFILFLLRRMERNLFIFFVNFLVFHRGFSPNPGGGGNTYFIFFLKKEKTIFSGGGKLLIEMGIKN